MCTTRKMVAVRRLPSRSVRNPEPTLPIRSGEAVDQQEQGKQASTAAGRSCRDLRAEDVDDVEPGRHEQGGGQDQHHAVICQRRESLCQCHRLAERNVANEDRDQNGEHSGQRGDDVERKLPATHRTQCRAERRTERRRRRESERDERDGLAALRDGSQCGRSRSGRRYERRPAECRDDAPRREERQVGGCRGQNGSERNEHEPARHQGRSRELRQQNGDSGRGHGDHDRIEGDGVTDVTRLHTQRGGDVGQQPGDDEGVRAHDEQPHGEQREARVEPRCV